MSYATADYDERLDGLVPELKVAINATGTTSATLGDEPKDYDDLETYMLDTSTATGEIETGRGDAEESLLLRVATLDVAHDAVQKREAELAAREQEVARREAALKRNEAALERRERATAQQQLALDQQRVLHAEEVAALGVRAVKVRREQGTVAASASELRIAQRSLREAQAALQAREQALAEHRECLLAEDFALNERAAEMASLGDMDALGESAALGPTRNRLTAANAFVAPGGTPPFSPVTLNAAETMAVLGGASTIGNFERETCDWSPPASATATATLGDAGAGVAEEIENVRQQMQEIERLRRDKRAKRMGSQVVQSNADGVAYTRSGASPFKPPRVVNPAATHADEASTFALNSSSLSSPASPWASEGPSMDYGLQLIEAGLNQQMIQPSHRVNSQPETTQEGRLHGKLAPVTGNFAL